MKQTLIKASLYHSNPLVMRAFTLPDGFPARDLSAACCIFFGLTPSYSFRLRADKEQGEPPLSVPETFSELSAASDSFFLDIVFDDHRLFSSHLTFFIQVEQVEEPWPPEAVPVLRRAIGLNLPPEVFESKEQNRIHQTLQKSGEAIGKNGGFFTYEDLKVKEARIENAIRRTFSPETAAAEVNTSLGAPLSLLLSSIKLPDLKDMAKELLPYLPSGINKPTVISTLLTEFNEDFIRRFFEELSTEEFLCFKQYVTLEHPDREDETICQKLPSFWQLGFLTRLPKKGLFFASPVLSYYETLFNTPAEELFLYRKKLTTAFNCCLNLYGLFDCEMFSLVAQKYLASDFSPDTAKQYFDEKLRQNSQNSLRTPDGCFVYSSSSFSKADALACEKTMILGQPIQFIPSREEIDRYAKTWLITELSEAPVKQLIAKFGGHIYLLPAFREDLARCIQRIHFGRTPAVAAATFSAPYRYSLALSQTEHTSFYQELTKIMSVYAQNIPVTTLHGYTWFTCPAPVKAIAEKLYTASQGTTRK